jgi:AraC family transcriptional regulator
MSASVNRMETGSYYGSRTQDYETSGFLLAESTYRQREALPVHSHEHAHFCLVLSGSYTECLEGGEVERRPGDLIFYPAGVDHAEQHHVDGRHFMIEVRPEVAGRLAGERRSEPWSSNRGATRAAATRIFGEFRREERVGAAPMKSLVEELVAVAVRRPPARPRPGWLGEVEERLRQAGEGSPDLASLAEEVGVHPVYLGRAFRSAYGCTPGEFLRRLRVERVQRALASAKAELADVAYASGFCDQSHLNRVFKRQTGMTPGRYRQLIYSGE